MIKKATSLKMFLAAVSTFMTVELADSPLRSLAYLSVFTVVGGNFWLKVEQLLTKRLSEFSKRTI